MKPAIRVEDLSKFYRLGVIGSGTLRDDLNRWWAKARGRPDPLSRVDARDHGNRDRNQIWALRDINLEIRKGEVLGLVGESGSGKSTIGRSILKLIDPTAGEVKFDGADLVPLSAREMRPYRRRSPARPRPCGL